MMRLMIFPVLLLFSVGILAQSQLPEGQIEINFRIIFDGEEMMHSDEKHLNQEGPIAIETLKFYVSSLQFYDQDELVFTEQNSYHLINFERPESLQLKVKMDRDVTFSKLSFQLGIDSLTSVSGAFGGDLDPMNGMYWTWQSGYINFKLEGIAENCPARQNRFNYHIGGYQSPFNALRTIELKTEHKKSMIIQVHIDRIFEHVDLTQNHTIMSPGKRAIEFANFLPSIFVAE